MPDFVQSLQGRDLGHLRIIAELCGVEFEARDARSGAARLATQLMQRQRLQETLEFLPLAAQEALQELLKSDGRLSWALFTRRYGAVREMGPARRDRERPFDNANASPAEALWYRGLVSKAFFDTANGAEEFAYIPSDLLELLPPVPRQQPSLGRPASPLERAQLTPADDAILADACTLLAGLRLGMGADDLAAYLTCGAAAGFPLTPAVLQALLTATGLLDENGAPQPEPTRAWLEVGRGEALALLGRAWLHSPAFNELRNLPGLRAEGEWRNDPLQARQAALDFLSTLPGAPQPIRPAAPDEAPFWSLAAFVADVKQVAPDFQRPAGNYDSYYLRDLASDQYLRGFEHWEAVDGALLRYIVCGPLHWLGFVDLTCPIPGGPVSGFRFSAWAGDLLQGHPPSGLPVEDERIQAGSDGRLRLPPGVPRSVRYQAARFSEWLPPDAAAYLYQLTPASLERARQQGLKTQHLLALLRRHAQAVPPSLVKAIERWETYGSEVRLQQASVLRLKDPALLQTLRGSKAGRFLGDPLGPTAVIVRPGAMRQVLAALAEMGYLGEVES